MFSSKAARMFHYITKNINYFFSLQIKSENIEIDSCDEKIKKTKRWCEKLEIFEMTSIITNWLWISLIFKNESKVVFSSRLMICFCSVKSP